MVNKTEKTLVQALTEFQAELPRVDLDAENPHFRSKYASLASVTKAVIPKLTEHGFAFSVGSFVDNGLLVVDAHLLHESGESRSLQFPITETNPQKIGSALSYARRYALSALTGVVADEDDDGNAASQPTATDRKLEKAKATPVKRPTTNSDQETIRAEFIDTGKMQPAELTERFQKIEKANSGKSRAEVYGILLAELRAEQ